MPITLSGIECGTIYHSASWHQALIEGFNIQVSHLVTEIDGKVVALTPLFLKYRYGLPLCGSPLKGLFTEFVGPRFDYQLEAKDRAVVVDNQISVLRSMRYPYIEIGIKSETTTDLDYIFSLMLKYGFVYYPRPSLVVDLTKGLEHLWMSFESRARNMIRKAEKNEVTVQVESLEHDLLKEYVAMIKVTFKRQSLAMPHSFAAYAALVRNLEPIGRLFFVSARYKGRLVSAGIFLTDVNRMIFHSGSSTSEGFTLAASSLVQWRAMQEGHNRGIEEYDLGGVGVNSIDTFKKSFGGVPVIHHRWVYSSTIIKHGSRLVYWLVSKGFLRIFK